MLQESLQIESWIFYHSFALEEGSLITLFERIQSFIQRRLKYSKYASCVFQWKKKSKGQIFISNPFLPSFVLLALSTFTYMV